LMQLAQGFIPPLHPELDNSNKKTQKTTKNIEK